MRNSTEVCYLGAEDLGALIKLLSYGRCAPDHSGNGQWVAVAVAGIETETRQAIERLLRTELSSGAVLRIKKKNWVSPERDFQGLVELLLRLRQIPDGLGDSRLTENEAARIRTLGFRAAAGPWRVPPLPHRLVAGGLFESLADRWREQENREYLNDGGATSEPCEVEIQLPDYPARKLHPVEEPRWSDDEVRVLAALRRNGGCLKRRILQRRHWRMKANRFNAALESLTQRRIVLLDRQHVRIIGDGKRSGDAQLQVELHAT